MCLKFNSAPPKRKDGVLMMVLDSKYLVQILATSGVKSLV